MLYHIGFREASNAISLNEGNTCTGMAPQPTRIMLADYATSISLSIFSDSPDSLLSGSLSDPSVSFDLPQPFAYP